MSDTLENIQNRCEKIRNINRELENILINMKTVDIDGKIDTELDSEREIISQAYNLLNDYVVYLLKKFVNIKGE